MDHGISNARFTSLKTLHASKHWKWNSKISTEIHSRLSRHMGSKLGKLINIKNNRFNISKDLKIHCQNKVIKM